MEILDYRIDDDPRQKMEYDTPYPLAGEALCSVPVHYVTGKRYADITVTKHHHSKQPDGHLYSRCPKHQAQYELNHAQR